VSVCGILGRYFVVSLSVAVQLIAWEDHPRNDLLRVERDVTAHSLAIITIYQLHTYSPTLALRSS